MSEMHKCNSYKSIYNIPLRSEELGLICSYYLGLASKMQKL